MPNPDGSPTSDELIGGNPTDTTGTGTVHPNPIGVPSAVYDPKTGQYVPWYAQVSGTEDDLRYRGGRPGTRQIPTTQFLPPRYFGGDELTPAGWSPDRIADLQRSLIAAGLIPQTASLRVGFWDATSQKGFETLLGYANQTGANWETALTRYGSTTEQGGPKRAPLTVRTSNPDDLRKVFRQTIIDTLGQGWDTAKIDQMVAAYQGVETSAQTQAYNMADTGGTVVQPPDPSTFASAQARQENPLGAQEHDVIAQGGPLDSFKQMIAGWQ